MKSPLPFLWVILILMPGCNNNKSKDTSTLISEKGKENVTVDIKQMENAAADMQKQKTQLEKLTPLTVEQLKALLPQTLMGVSRKNYDANTTMGAGLATANYELNDSMNLKLNIYDCAGPGGAGIYSLQYLSMINMQQESDEEYTKTFEFNGSKAFEHCEKTDNNCTFTYFTGGRFLVTLEGDHIGAEALKQTARGLDIK